MILFSVKCDYENIVWVRFIRFMLIFVADSVSFAGFSLI